MAAYSGNAARIVLQLGFLLVARDRDVAPLPGRDALLQGGVVEHATAPEHLLQRPLLGGRRPQLLLVGLAHRWLLHMVLFCLIGTEPARAEAESALPLPLKRRGLRRAKALFCQRRHSPSATSRSAVHSPLREALTQSTS